MRFSPRLAALTALSLGAALTPAWVTPASAAPTTFVVDDNLECPDAAFSTITDAVNKASDGDTIQVCAGIYPETVKFDKSLSFVGAKAGQDGRSHRGDLALESVVVSLSGDFIVAGPVNNVRIDGFTLRGAGSDDVTAAAIEASLGGSGLTVVNNVIRDNQRGLNVQNPDSSMSTVIARNAFINNSLGTSPQGGTAVFIANGPANNTMIESNRFVGDRDTAINTTGDARTPSVGLVVANNGSHQDTTFLLATNTKNALVDNNGVAYSGTENASAILDAGDNRNLRITHNRISGGSNDGGPAIRLSAQSGPASTATTLIGNKIVSRSLGIRATDGYTDLFVAYNTVSDSTIGISVDASSTGNTFLHNVIKRSAKFDCLDESSGTLTAGTGNLWRRNHGDTGSSMPADICPI